jgi:ketosteroid isomerase-like protein
MRHPLQLSTTVRVPVNDYAWSLDHPFPDPALTARKFASLFTPDGELTMPDDDLQQRTYVGRKAIAKIYLENRTDTKYLHVTSNIRVTPTSDKTATGTSYASFHIHSATGSMKDEGAITGITEYRDEYRITGKGCKLFKRIAVIRLLRLIGYIEDPVTQ